LTFSFVEHFCMPGAAFSREECTFHAVIVRSAGVMRMKLVLASTFALGCGTAVPNAQDASTVDGSVDAGFEAGIDAGTDATTTDAGADAGDPIAKLLALTSSCNQVSNGLFALNAGDTPTVPICGLTNALFWKADMDIDCDGKTTTQCSLQTDPDYQNQTAATDSQNNPLDAANLPYVVVPGKSTKFDAAANGLKLGDVILVVYKGQVEYAVYGDVGPSADIGEASYATANALGVNPDPKVGGVDTPDVLYVAFTGSSALVSPIEDHAKAVTVGQARLAQLVQ
jgi:hypothetical protein